MTRPIALVGIGDIARAQHIPTLNASADWHLAAAANRSDKQVDVPFYNDLGALLAAHPEVESVSLALPPVPRFAAAMQAIAAGRHVMLEKPPGATLSEIRIMQTAAEEAGVVLYASWHSRSAAGVAQAKAWLADKLIKRCHIQWHEQVFEYHKSLSWESKAGGMGVFDPGINALSIMTEILPMAVSLTSSDLFFPENWETPIAAKLAFTGGVTADFDWRHPGPGDIWRITVETDQGPLVLDRGGQDLLIGGEPVAVGPHDEYGGLYAHFAELVADGRSDVDVSPMLHVADALTLGRRTTVAPFPLQMD